MSNLILILTGVSVPFLLYLCYLNYRIYEISKDIYRVSEALLEVNVSIYQVTVELLEASKKLEEKI